MRSILLLFLSVLLLCCTANNPRSPSSSSDPRARPEGHEVESPTTCSAILCDQDSVAAAIDTVQVDYGHTLDITLWVDPSYEIDDQVPQIMWELNNAFQDAIQWRLTALEYVPLESVDYYHSGDEFGLPTHYQEGSINIYVCPNTSDLLGFAAMPSHSWKDYLHLPIFNSAFVSAGPEGGTDFLTRLTGTIIHELGHLNSLDHNFDDCADHMSYGCSPYRFAPEELDQMNKWVQCFRSDNEVPIQSLFSSNIPKRGPPPAVDDCYFDIDKDGRVDSDDFLIFNSHYGKVCTDHMTEMVILQGSHTATGRPFVSTSDPIRGACVLPSSAIYDLGSSDQLDINKLHGLNLFEVSNHVNSARIGWRWNLDTQRFELLAYLYVNASRVQEWEAVGTTHLATVRPDEYFTWEIEHLPDNSGLPLQQYTRDFGETTGAVAISINGRTTYWPFRGGHSSFMQPQWFYFGGNRRAPRRINAYFHFVRI